MTRASTRLLPVVSLFALALVPLPPPLHGLHRPHRLRPAARGVPQTAIQHLVVVIQENHSFDSYYGHYCKAPSGSSPTCTSGPQCCEAGPDHDPGQGYAPVVLDDVENASYDPNHNQSCELTEIDGGRMDRYTNNPECGNPRNFAYATQDSASTYWKLATTYTLADRYFQPVAGASSSNDMYFARAQYVFTDNQVGPNSVGSLCGDVNPNRKTYDDLTIGDLLTQAGVSWAYYAEGYRLMQQAQAQGRCPTPDPSCAVGSEGYPCIYDPSDNPFQYYRNSMDNALTQKDYADFAQDIDAGRLPAVSFVKGLGYKTEHPGVSNISDGERFVSEVVGKVLGSPDYAQNTLVLVTPDESGGFFDHVPPPPASQADGKPYGPRIPLLAIGAFARPGAISHETMEHSSIVRFIEWNWLGTTGQLHGRDALVNNIGSLLDPAKTGTAVP